jgi:Spy/CpxP family protein refolding chaperone
MNTPNQTSLLQRLRAHTTILAFVAGIATAAGVGALASTDAVVAIPGGHRHAMTAEDMAKHIDQVAAHLYKAVNATDAQKALLDPILRQGATDLMPMHQQFHDAHAQLLGLMTQSNIDRAALEVFRQQELQALDQTSKRLMQLLADVGDVLTPAQRQALVAHIRAMHGEHHHG